MFRFLKNLRSGKQPHTSFNKYIFYALGEILLVVVGILIALQVNNWNIDRIERKKEKEILNDLKIEFEANLSDAMRTTNGHVEIIRKMNKLQSFFELPVNRINPRSIDSCMFALFDWFTFTPKPGASQALINSGEMNLITNKELRNLLVLWSGVVADLQDDEILAVTYSQDHVVPFLAKNYPIRNLENLDYNVSNDSSEKLGKDLEENLPPVNFDLQSILESEEFKSHVSTKKILARHNVLEGNVVIKTINSILITINSELQD